MKLFAAALFSVLTLALAAPADMVPATAGAPPQVEWAPGPFRKMKEPIFSPSASGLDDKNVYNMAVVKKGSEFWMLYRGESTREKKDECTGRLFLARSRDGVKFERDPKPVLVGSEPYESNGVEDPRIVEVEGTYYLTYSGYNGKIAQLCLATSKDLRNWKKHGPMFPKFPQNAEKRYSEDWSKSGAILPERLKSGRFAGKYVMVFGDTDLWLAHSDDLLHWSYLPEPVMKVRKDRHDCALVEPGPPLMMTRQGILLLYNSADRSNHYAMMAALFDPEDPTRIKARTNAPFLEPTLKWEVEGYVPHVVFGEALVRDGDHWNLYYGAGDRQIGLARAPYRGELFR